MTRLALLALLALAALAALPAAAQPAADSAPPRPWWLNLGLVGASDDMLGLGVGLTVARSAARILSVRGVLAEEWQWCWGGPCAAPPDRNVDVGVLYGVAQQHRWFVASLAAGAAVAALRRTTRDPSHETSPRTTREVTLGVPIEGQLFVRPFRNVGVGGAVMFDLNPKQSFSGVLVGLQLGRLTPPWGPR